MKNGNVLSVSPPRRINVVAYSKHWRACSGIQKIFFFLLICCVLLLCYIGSNWTTSTSTIEKRQFSDNNFKKAMSIKTFKALKLAEHENKITLKTSEDNEIRRLESLYQRNITFNWDNKHGFIPPSKPVFYKHCLRYLEGEYSSKVSVVISFKDELLSILLRTLTTLVFRTPVHLLHEIILVDDGSFQNHRQDVLKHFQLLDVMMVWYRRNSSVGIANARHFGIKQAAGDVVAILDSHMVVSEMWLQPLLATLSQKPRGIAVPLVQMIMDDEYDKYHLCKINPYSWKMIRGYQGLDFTDFYLNKTDETQPYPTPVIGGGAMVAKTTTLLELWPRQIYKGSWGVENLRLSLRAWTCAGGLWVSVCGQITHPNGLDPNLSRYNVNNPEIKKFRLSETAGEIVNVMKNRKDSERLIQSTYFSELRGDIFKTAELISKSFNYTKCEKDYDWYLNNVHGTYHFKLFDHPMFEHVGVFQSAAEPNRCLVNIISKNQVGTDTECGSIIASSNPGVAKNIDIADPHLMGISANPRGVTISTDVYYSPTCWDAHHSGDQKPISFWTCHVGSGESLPQQQFAFDTVNHQIQHLPTNRCVEMIRNVDRVELNSCDVENVEQRWILYRPSWWRV